jgi:hypothetical protein
MYPLKDSLTNFSNLDFLVPAGVIEEDIKEMKPVLIFYDRLVRPVHESWLAISTLAFRRIFKSPTLAKHDAIITTCSETT